MIHQRLGVDAGGRVADRRHHVVNVGEVPPEVVRGHQARFQREAAVALAVGALDVPATGVSASRPGVVDRAHRVAEGDAADEVRLAVGEFTEPNLVVDQAHHQCTHREATQAELGSRCQRLDARHHFIHTPVDSVVDSAVAILPAHPAHLPARRVDQQREGVALGGAVPVGSVAGLDRQVVGVVGNLHRLGEQVGRDPVEDAGVDVVVASLGVLHGGDDRAAAHMGPHRGAKAGNRTDVTDPLPHAGGAQAVGESVRPVGFQRLLYHGAPDIEPQRLRGRGEQRAVAQFLAPLLQVTDGARQRTAAAPELGVEHVATRRRGGQVGVVRPGGFGQPQRGQNLVFQNLAHRPAGAVDGIDSFQHRTQHDEVDVDEVVVGVRQVLRVVTLGVVNGCRCRVARPRIPEERPLQPEVAGVVHQARAHHQQVLHGDDAPVGDVV